PKNRCATPAPQFARRVQLCALPRRFAANRPYGDQELSWPGLSQETVGCFVLHPLFRVLFSSEPAVSTLAKSKVFACPRKVTNFRITDLDSTITYGIENTRVSCIASRRISAILLKVITDVTLLFNKETPCRLSG